MKPLKVALRKTCKNQKNIPPSTLVYLAPRQVVIRWGGSISEKTLANWRSLQLGPPFIRLRKRVLYPLDALIKWEAEHTKG